MSMQGLLEEFKVRKVKHLFTSLFVGHDSLLAFSNASKCPALGANSLYFSVVRSSRQVYQVTVFYDFLGLQNTFTSSFRNIRLTADYIIHFLGGI